MHFRTVIPLVMALLSGCGLTSDEDRHLEHVIPAHKPRSFAETVEQIHQRLQALREAEPGPERSVQLQELGDIIRWIPELAADSDLRRPHWKQARDIAVQMQSQFERMAATDSVGSAEVDELMKGIADLRRLVPFSDETHTSETRAGEKNSPPLSFPDP